MTQQLNIEPIGLIETPFREPAGNADPALPCKRGAGKSANRSTTARWAKDLEGFERSGLN